MQIQCSKNLIFSPLFPPSKILNRKNIKQYVNLSNSNGGSSGVLFTSFPKRRRCFSTVIASSSTNVNAPLFDTWSPDKATPSPSLSDVLWPSLGMYIYIYVPFISFLDFFYKTILLHLRRRSIRGEYLKHCIHSYSRSISNKITNYLVIYLCLCTGSSIIPSIC